MIEEKKVPEVPKYDSARVIVNLRIATLQLVTTLGSEVGSWSRLGGARLVSAIVNRR